MKTDFLSLLIRTIIAIDLLVYDEDVFAGLFAGLIAVLFAGLSAIWKRNCV